MKENKNMKLNDEMMAQATGGTGVDVDHYGYIGDGTVQEGEGMSGKTNGVQNTVYSVVADSGKGYWAVWRGTDAPAAGTRVSIYHIEDGWNSGGYEMEQIN